ncbi:hypothetical protein [Pseudomonas sp. MWU15-20650]|uniref:hypothetical protein n=1 Tax=Pseudomonas sp. MWU15-20650 TaxID=2933107 RepID=UPI00200F2FA4|nr:hypothetical protein [Pseudomonas sp. MWU15-20650]
MDSKHLSRKQLFLAPEIKPSHGTVVKYHEVTGGKGRIVIPHSPALAVGHTVYWSVKGNGLEFSSFKIDKVEAHYERTLKFDVVFKTEEVVASYFVKDDAEIIGYSHESTYTVLEE